MPLLWFSPFYRSHCTFKNRGNGRRTWWCFFGLRGFCERTVALVVGISVFIDQHHWPWKRGILALRLAQTQRSAALILPNTTPAADQRAVLNPNSEFSMDCEYTPVPPKRRSAHWGTVSIVLGLLAIAILLSVAHYVLFSRLDGIIADGELALIRQSFVTAISILLSVLFRAALLGAVGICFAQVLWRTLRGNPLPVSTIESLFQIRSNPFELLNLRTVRRSVLLFLLAAYMWLVPVAVTFPPSALTITPRPFIAVEHLNSSTVNPLMADDFDPFQDFDQLETPRIKVGHQTLPVDYQYTRPSGGEDSPLASLSKTVILNGDISQTPNLYPERNSSQRLRFMGPQLTCTTQTTKLIVDSNDIEKVRGPTLNQTNGNYTLTDRLWGVHLLWFVADSGYGLTPDSYGAVKIEQNKIMGGINCSLEDPPSCPFLAIENTNTTCREEHTSYTVDINWVNGVRNVAIEKERMEPQPTPVEAIQLWLNGTVTKMTIDGVTNKVAGLSGYSDWVSQIREAMPIWTSLQILETFLLLLYTVKSAGCEVANAVPYDWLGPNDTTTRVTPVTCNPNLPGFSLKDRGPSILEDSRLNPRRYNRRNNTGLLDGQNALNQLPITEAALNELLTNITLSTMSLSVWYRPTDINTTQYRNTYDFSRPVNLVLPYTLCLGLGIVIIALGLHALRKNEVVAADGSFLQIAMAAHSPTEMTRLFAEQGVASPFGIPRELKDLEVRYGELVVGEDASDAGLKRRCGFGTVEETVSLRGKR
ncbi:hypothetical protein OPT61_g3959 [Boeremia exigua]|uniref:Uncharacterized protein n=1 Tax=Boeremia exigua TaxID=749465 RepID=A0ACC2IFZ6_9PLEO|nr:hypothetical protein OPT61_g3959 [Boeremia exigua]